MNTNQEIPYKIYLEENELPKYWYNMRADMKTKPAPLLNSETLKPMTEDGRLCAKEVCNLKFFSRLNKEMPIYLREQGFDIADCVAYDAGLDKSEFLEEISDESRKGKKQHGVDSRTFKYQQEQEKVKLDKEIEDRKAIKAGLDETIRRAETEASKKADIIIDDANFLFDFAVAKAGRFSSSSFPSLLDTSILFKSINLN